MSRGQRRTHAMLWLVLAPLLLIAVYWAYQGRAEYGSDSTEPLPTEAAS